MNKVHFTEKFDQVRTNIERVIVGKTEEIEIILAAMLAGGHVLLEDVPGTGKTLLSKTLSKSFDINFGRVQFTPDLLPSDIIGLNLYNPKESNFSLKKGAIFTNILLADEINRATPRTQSALLESMEERQVSIDGVTHKLEPPYFVIATQNPIETQGTFPLPEAQLDRFLIKLSLGRLGLNETVQVLQGGGGTQVFEEVKSVVTQADLLELMEYVKTVHVSCDVAKYIAELSDATHRHDHIAFGVSIRGSLALLNISKAWSAIRGRDYVVPDDVQKLLPFVFMHRLVMRGSQKRGQSDVLNGILESVKTPVEAWSKEL